MAFDRLLIAYLSRFQARPLLAELVKHFGCPAKTPRFNDAPTFPMQSIGSYKAESGSQLPPFMRDGDPFTAIAFESDTLSEGPILFRLSIATAHADFADALRMELA